MNLKSNIKTVVLMSLIFTSALAADFEVKCQLQEKNLVSGKTLNYKKSSFIKNILPGHQYNTVELELRKGKNPIGVAVTISSNTRTNDVKLKIVSMGSYISGPTILGQPREFLSKKNIKSISSGLLSISDIDGAKYKLSDYIEIVTPESGDSNCSDGAYGNNNTHSTEPSTGAYSLGNPTGPYSGNQPSGPPSSGAYSVGGESSGAYSTPGPQQPNNGHSSCGSNYGLAGTPVSEPKEINKTADILFVCELNQI